MAQARGGGHQHRRPSFTRHLQQTSAGEYAELNPNLGYPDFSFSISKVVNRLSGLMWRKPFGGQNVYR